jgi:hypothetical protein
MGPSFWVDELTRKPSKKNSRNSQMILHYIGAYCVCAKQSLPQIVQTHDRVLHDTTDDHDYNNFYNW